MTQVHNFKCPKCGDRDNVDIEVTCWARVCDDGTDTDIPADGTKEFDNDNAAQCAACLHHGTVASFLPTPDADMFIEE